MVHLLDLPIEILRHIFDHYYGHWSIYLSSLKIRADGDVDLRVHGVPGIGPLLTCRQLHLLCKEQEQALFTKHLWANEEHSPLGLLPKAFMDILSGTSRCIWVRESVKVIRLSNFTTNPAVWKVDLRLEDFPKLEKVELDCRYQTHFAVHNVEDYQMFITGQDGLLERSMDFRKSFFLICERFFAKATRAGLAVTVIRSMCVREGKKPCQAVVALVDYIRDEDDQLVLDMANIRTHSKQITGWPHGIKPALAALAHL